MRVYIYTFTLSKKSRAFIRRGECNFRWLIMILIMATCVMSIMMCNDFARAAMKGFTLFWDTIQQKLEFNYSLFELRGAV